MSLDITILKTLFFDTELGVDGLLVQIILIGLITLAITRDSKEMPGVALMTALTLQIFHIPVFMPLTQMIALWFIASVYDTNPYGEIVTGITNINAQSPKGRARARMTEILADAETNRQLTALKTAETDRRIAKTAAAQGIWFDKKELDQARAIEATKKKKAIKALTADQKMLLEIDKQVSASMPAAHQFRIKNKSGMEDYTPKFELMSIKRANSDRQARQMANLQKRRENENSLFRQQLESRQKEARELQLQKEKENAKQRRHQNKMAKSYRQVVKGSIVNTMERNFWAHAPELDNAYENIENLDKPKKKRGKK